MSDEPLLPSQIMRSNRPTLFSDTEAHHAYRLSESELRHHLATLTDRNQHKDFEVFCRKLAQRSLCPNLRPQTGAEAGGDGKVDTETYPVGASISDHWYFGVPDAGAGYYGFAISARKDWARKVREDVSGLIGTGRKYDRIYCITNRPARQADRLALETELSATHDIPIHILDQEWIIDRVLTDHNEDLAFTELGAGAYDLDNDRLGPRDTIRTSQLEEREIRLKRVGASVAEMTQAVTDAFEAAILSRHIERPQFETQGRFDRAIRLATKHGTESQQLRAAYEKAWTAFWWFDDLEGMLEAYQEIERLAFATNQAVHVGRVATLFQVLIGHVSRGMATREETDLTAKGVRLRQALQSQIEDTSRPTTPFTPKPCESWCRWKTCCSPTSLTSTESGTLIRTS